MSYYDYMKAREIMATDPPFYALIMAAAKKADTGNLARLEAAFPVAIREQRARYDSPAGLLVGDSDALKENVCAELGTTPSALRPLLDGPIQ